MKSIVLDWVEVKRLFNIKRATLDSVNGGGCRTITPCNTRGAPAHKCDVRKPSSVCYKNTISDKASDGVCGKVAIDFVTRLSFPFLSSLPLTAYRFPLTKSNGVVLFLITFYNEIKLASNEAKSLRKKPSSTRPWLCSLTSILFFT